MSYSNSCTPQCLNCVFLKLTLDSDYDVSFGCKRNIDKSDLYNPNNCKEVLSCPSKFSSNVYKLLLEQHNVLARFGL